MNKSFVFVEEGGVNNFRVDLVIVLLRNNFLHINQSIDCRSVNWPWNRFTLVQAMEIVGHWRWLIVAGIFSATLSSSLGCINFAPKIFQVWLHYTSQELCPSFRCWKISFHFVVVMRMGNAKLKLKILCSCFRLSVVIISSLTLASSVAVTGRTTSRTGPMGSSWLSPLYSLCPVSENTKNVNHRDLPFFYLKQLCHARLFF